MKTIKFLSLAGLLLSASFLNSCKDDSDSQIDPVTETTSKKSTYQEKIKFITNDIGHKGSNYEITQDDIDKYVGIVGYKGEKPSVEEVNSISQNVSANYGADYKDLLKKYNYSADATSIINTIITNSYFKDVASAKGYERLTNAEKAVVGQINDMVKDYTLNPESNPFERRIDCTINGQESPCWLAGGIGGAIIGGACCGPVGAVIGGVVGAVFGSLGDK